MSEPILQINHLSKTFGSHEVLRDIDFSVNPGDVTSIIGASGSGKSTLLRCINLLETPTSGEILYHGTNIDNIKGGASAYRSHVGMVFQSFNLFNNMTALKNCMIGQTKVLKKSRAEAKASALHYLEKVGMAPYINAKPSQLSGGQKQRVAIARALAMEPEVLLFDRTPIAVIVSVTEKLARRFSSAYRLYVPLVASSGVDRIIACACFLSVMRTISPPSAFVRMISEPA